MPHPDLKVEGPAFEHERSAFIGGSDIAAILGISPWANQVDLWIKKTRLAGDDTSNLQAKKRGSRLEPYIRQMITDEYGLQIVRHGMRYYDADIPYFCAEIDFEAADPAGGADINGEIKTSMFNSKDWGPTGTDQLPEHYLAQVQWGMGVNGAQECRVFALLGDNLKGYTVQRDDELITAMRKLASEFWTQYVMTGIRPPIEHGHPSALETLRKLYPGTDGTTVKATETHEHWRKVIEDAQARVKRYEAIVDEGKAHLMDEMGSAAILAFPDGLGYVRKEVKRATYTVEATAYVDMRLKKLKENKE